MTARKQENQSATEATQSREGDMGCEVRFWGVGVYDGVSVCVRERERETGGQKGS